MKSTSKLFAALLIAVPLAALAQTSAAPAGAQVSPNAPGASSAQPTTGRMNTVTGVDATDTKKNSATRRVAKKPVTKKDAGSGPGDPSARPNAASKKDGS